MSTSSAGVHQEGFTLIELMVGILISIIVILATFQSLDVFSKSTKRQTTATDASDQIRTLMERTVRDLRGAAAITYAGPQDLIYTVSEPTGTRTRRICVSGNQLYGWSTLAPTTAPTSGTPCSSGSKIATLKTTSKTGFTYDGAASSSTPATVKNVGLTLSLDTTSESRTSSSTLTASASRRVGTLELTDDALDVTCVSDGALLKLDASVAGVAGLTVSFTNDAGTAIGTAVSGGVKIARGTTNVVATVTNSTGLSSILHATVEC
jgi:Tfp pilus assembly protein PilW